jgi:flagellar protein FlaG
MAMSVTSVQQTPVVAADRTTNVNSAKSNEQSGADGTKNIEELRATESKGSRLSIGEEKMVKRIERALEAAKGPVTTLELSIHEQTKEVVIRVKNKETGELIREVPPEKILDMVAKFMELNGIIIDERV